MESKQKAYKGCTSHLARTKISCMQAESLWNMQMPAMIYATVTPDPESQSSELPHSEIKENYHYVCDLNRVSKDNYLDSNI